MPDLPGRIRGLFRPEAYQGEWFRPPYFEGWYFKLVDRRCEERLAIIPGLIRTADPADSHAFLQIFDGLRREYRYLRYPLSEFRASRRRLDVRVGGSRFTRRGATLAVARDGVTLHGQLRLHGLKPWPVRPWAPGAMGWYAFMPFMECYHGVVSMDHALAGQLTLNGHPLSFDGGRGYLEKDWGRAFPSSWIWLQSNHFPTEGTSLMASIARIPWIGRSFPGLLMGFQHDGRLHRFATYTGARTERLEVGENLVRWTVRDWRHELRIAAHRGQTTPLKGPSLDGMERVVDETLDARLEVQLTRRGFRGGLVFEGEGRAAGMEVHGDCVGELGASRRSS